MRQEPGTNLCGYYVCEHIHGFTSPNPGDYTVRKKVLTIDWFVTARILNLGVTYLHFSTLQTSMIQDALITKDCLLAVQESLMGFLMDEVTNPKGKHYYDGHPLQKI